MQRLPVSRMAIYFSDSNVTFLNVTFSAWIPMLVSCDQSVTIREKGSCKSRSMMGSLADRMAYSSKYKDARRGEGVQRVDAFNAISINLTKSKD